MVIMMKCNLCDGKGKIKIENFGRVSIQCCYICEGIGKIENCTNCNGTGERIIKVEGLFDFSPCMICMGHGIKPKIEKCPCNGKGYIWAQVGYDEPEYEPQPCGCHDKNMER
jgi:RecJ-like exonuclease